MASSNNSNSSSGGGGGGGATEMMESILDFSKPIDVSAFDRIIDSMSNGSPSVIMRAQEVLVQFKEHPDAFLRVDKLLSESHSINTKFFALQVLDETIVHRWNTLDEANQQAIRHFITNMIVQQCTSFEHVRASKMLLTKMNSTLVAIAQREWPLRWPTFIQDICTSANPTHPLVENNLNLLRLIGEEVFEFGTKTLTSRWVERKKQALAEDIRFIMELCATVLLTSSDLKLLKVTLETLTEYVPWIKPIHIFHEQVLEVLCRFVVGDSIIRTAAMKCLSEICAVKVSSGAEGDRQTQLIVRVVKVALQEIVSALPTKHSSVMLQIVDLYENGTEVDETYVNYLALMLISFLRNYYRSISYDDSLLLLTHELLVGMSNIYDKELFKSCVEYWFWLGDFIIHAPASNTKRNLVTKLPRILSDVRYVLIRRMAKPEEVVIVEEDGELRREHMADVEELQLYALMRETLFFLTRIDPKDTRRIMVALMHRQLDRSEWSWHNCNTLSWAVGAISGAMDEDEENEMYVEIMKGLMQLCRELQGKENRAVVASDVMFVVGQYPQYLRTRVTFLYTVARKLFEFMHETFPGVQDMAVDTFLKVSKAVPSEFVQRGNGPCFAEETAKQWTFITSMLNPQQIQTCFAAVGCMIAADDKNEQANLLSMFLYDTDASFRSMVNKVHEMGDVAFCGDVTLLKELLHYLRIYSSIAQTCGNAFIHQMNMIVIDLYNFYRLFSIAQDRAIAESNLAAALNREEFKYLRLCKREILRCFERFVQNTQEIEFVVKNCIPDMFTVVLLDYENASPHVKEAGALTLTATCVNTLGNRLELDCAAILDHTFNTTISMLADSMESFPEFRVNLFKLLQSLNKYCFEAFVAYAAMHEDIIGGMLWAIKHTDYPTMITGLQTLDTFLAKVAFSNVAEQFYSAYIQRVFVDVLVTAMDTLHAAGFHWHCNILTKLFQVSANVPPETPMFGRNAVTSFLRDNLTIIPTLTETSIMKFINMCYSEYRNEEQFRTQFADFLIEVQIWGAEEENKLLEEERHARMHSNGINNSENNHNNNNNTDETNLYFPPLHTIANASRTHKTVSLGNTAELFCAATSSTPQSNLQNPSEFLENGPNYPLTWVNNSIIDNSTTNNNSNVIQTNSNAFFEESQTQQEFMQKQSYGANVTRQK